MGDYRGSASQAAVNRRQRLLNEVKEATVMARRAKTNRVPRTRAGGEWTEAAFWGFIRSGMRQLSRRWPPLVRIALNEVKRKSQSENKRLKWEFQCNHCSEWFARKHVEVDHIVECGSLKSFADLSQFADRLFCEASGLRVLCVKCHQKRKSA
jgi:hypothetical protein